MNTKICYDDQRLYKYTLHGSDYTYRTRVRPEQAAQDPDGFIALATDGTITIKVGYAWDGPSGPAFDSPKYMRGSLVHDALYQLLRAKILDNTPEHRRAANRTFFEILTQDKMFVLRRLIALLAVTVGCKRRSQPGTGPRKFRVCIDAGKVVQGRRYRRCWTPFA